VAIKEWMAIKESVSRVLGEFGVRVGSPPATIP